MLNGASSPEELVECAAEQGITHLALTDINGVYGAVRFQKACEQWNIKPIFGAEVSIESEGQASGSLVFLAADNRGYELLCNLLTQAHLRNRNVPILALESCAAFAKHGFCLTGTQESRLWKHLDAGDWIGAQKWLNVLSQAFGERLFIEVANHGLEYSKQRLRELLQCSELMGIPVCASGDVRYAKPDHYRRYDLMRCIHHIQSVFHPHPDRPKNAEQYLKNSEQLLQDLGNEQAFLHAQQIAQACQVDLLPGYVTPPKAAVERSNPSSRLRQLAEKGLLKRYKQSAEVQRARPMIERELAVIEDLMLEEYFLVVHEIVSEAKRRGILCSGRGSAANSIVCYVLGITHVDPIRHRLLFERFLHRGRKGTPDIDIDFDTERRDEIITWIVHRFGIDQTAMTATVVTYQLRSAFRDVAKALGWPIEKINTVSKQLPHGRCSHIDAYRELIIHHFGKSPLVSVLINMVKALEECPRHLGLHAGGMVLSREPLNRFTPVQISANGVKMVQFDKDDVEALGLIKFDILGLRMLACISEAQELIHRYIDSDFDVDQLALDDPATFEMICSGKTLACFQIESQGQLHLLARNQPENFDDLIAEIALFRPGPLQGGVVHPFVNRRKGIEPTRYAHPCLEPILKDTYGIILFQEQVLEVVHRFAGLSLEEADRFRQLMSKFRDPGDMEDMRVRFVQGAQNQGIDEATATDVFEKVSKFVGYGFCRSHAAAFAKIVYQSAFLKCHFPAAYLAAFMQHRPGMYNQMTLEEEARRFGVAIKTVDINRSSMRFDISPHKMGWAIQKPIMAVAGMTPQQARNIVMQRMKRAFTSVEDVYIRCNLHVDVMRNLARSGAFDSLESDSRKALWKVGVLYKKWGRTSRVQPESERPQNQQPQSELFDRPLIEADEIPMLPSLSPSEKLDWDYDTHQAGRVHPMTLVRRELIDLEIRPIEKCYRLAKTNSNPFLRDSNSPIISTAGIVILRQRPPTANGFMFVTLEDETGFIQCIVAPDVCTKLSQVLFHSSLIVKGQVGGEKEWAGLLIQDAWILNQTFGGYEGRPSYGGGKDNWVRNQAQNATKALVGVERFHELLPKNKS